MPTKTVMQTVKIDDREFRVPLTIERRVVRGETMELVSPEASALYQRALARAIIEAGAMGPRACSCLRAEVKQTSEVLSQAFGVDRKTFYRWTKSGEQPMPPAVWIVLARIVIEDDEGRRDMLDMLLKRVERAA